MEQIVITKANGNTLPLFSRERPSAISKATQKVALLSDDLVSLTVVSATPIDFDFGDTISVFGKPYRLNQLPQPTKEGERKFTYELTLEGLQYDLIDVIYHLPETAVDNPQREYYGEHLYADLEEHLKTLLWNINRIYPGKWTLGTYPKDTEFKNLNAQGKNCLQVLQEYCNEYGVEFEIAINASKGTYTLNIKEKVGGTFGTPLYYGRGKGLFKLQRKNVNNAGITTRLYVYGGSCNLGNDYGHTRLCLPGTRRLTSYIEDAPAVRQYGVKENTKTYDDIKPERIGEVTALGGNILTFDDSTMFDLNKKKSDGSTEYLIADTTAKITFQTGNLAGYSFDIHSYNHKTHTFVINKFQDENGLEFPNPTSAAFQIAQHDKYILTDINLPDEYIADAEAKLKAAGEKDLANICQPQVSYTLQLDEQFFTRIYGRKIPSEVLHVGDYLHIIDEQIGVNKEIRITQIERDLLKPHSYTIQVSDTITKTTTVRVINELQNLSEIVDINGLADPTVARRRWKTAQELLSMVFDPDGDYYTERIKPLSIDTAMLSVGAKSQQFVLKNVTFEPNYNGNYRSLHISAGSLHHYAINEDDVVTWLLSEATFTLDTLNAYYIYAGCSRRSNSAYWLVTTEQLKVDRYADEWLFLVGTVSSPITSTSTQKPTRSVSLTYGFSTVNGRFVKTGRIESTAGTCYFDLDNNEIGGVVKFTKSDGTTGSVSDVDDKTNETKDYINNTLPGILDEMQAQLDGQIEQFFYDYNPSNDSEPTNEWIAADTKSGTSAEREKHLGDLFYNTSTGKVWRYIKHRRLRPARQGEPLRIVTIYEWQQLSDEELEQALQVANDALDLAKTKRRIFTTTPTTPYEIGDLWVQGTKGDIMRCKVTRLTGSYNASDWEKASKYTDDTALNTFITGQFANTVTSLTTQIDGKIETWFQATDPANNWAEADKRAHHGDMWYNTNTKELKRYTWYENARVAYGRWLAVEDKTAIAAYEAASKAQDTADGKRRVFVATPYPPYDVGDLWLTGGKSNGVLMRCINARAAGSKYYANDWEEAVYYDNTKTTIDGGIVTSGTVQLISPVSESIVAGITGGENETARTSAANKVRIWAGASKANRFSAPFRVLQDGSFVASKGKITGEINANTGTIGGFEIGTGRIGAVGSATGGAGGDGLSLYKDFICFSDAETWVGMGSNVLPVETGITALCRVENTRYNPYRTNLGTIINVSGAAHNIGISANCAINSSTWIKDYGFATINPATNNCQIIGDATNPNPFKIRAYYTNSNSGIGLPSRQSVARILAISTATAFAVKITIFGDTNSTVNGYIVGRNTVVGGMNDDKYPYIRNNDGGWQAGKIGHGKGDVDEFLLVYEGNSAQYNAYWLTHRN